MNYTRKGKRIVKLCVDMFRSMNYIAENVEKPTKFQKKDLFTLFDVIALSPARVVFVQVRSNRIPTKTPYLKFQKAFMNVDVELWVWHDRQGFEVLEMKKYINNA